MMNIQITGTHRVHEVPGASQIRRAKVGGMLRIRLQLTRRYRLQAILATKDPFSELKKVLSLSFRRNTRVHTLIDSHVDVVLGKVSADPAWLPRLMDSQLQPRKMLGSVTP